VAKSLLYILGVNLNIAIIYKAFLPVEEHTRLLHAFNTQVQCLCPTHFGLHHAMTFRPAGLSRDPHGIG